MSEKDKENDIERNGKGMKRRLGVLAVFSICTGAMFSSGFFLLPGLAAYESGPSIPFIYLTASLLIIPAIYSIAELSSAMPRSGGPYFFITRSFGPLLGIVGAFGKFLQLVLKGAFAFVGVGAYLSLLIDVQIQPIAIGMIVIFTLLNLSGVRQTATTEIILVAILLLLLTYFTISGITEILGEEKFPVNRFQPLLPFGWEGAFSAIALIFVSYGGVGQVASVSEEIKNPSRAIPYGMFIALIVSTIFYFLGTAIMVALKSPDALQGTEVPVAITAEEFTSFPLPVWIVVVAALAAFASTGNAAILSAARYPLALARDHLIWSKFSKLDKKGVPRYAVICTGAILIILVLAFEVETIAKYASAFLLFIFLGITLAVIIFRESKINEYQPGYQSPLYPWMQIAGIIIYIWLIVESGIEAIAFILAVCIIGILWYYFGKGKQTKLSGAIFILFGRLARQSPQKSIAGDLGMPLLGGPQLNDLIERAIFIDLDDESNLKEVVEQAADALRDRVGGDRKEMADHLHSKAKRWMSSIEPDIVVSPVLLPGIEQPELVIIRGDIKIEEKDYHGLMVLVDDEESSNRLFQLLTKLEESISHSEFLSAWKKAKDVNELKDALLHGIQTLTIKIQESGPTSEISGITVKDAEFPKGSVVVLIHRDGKDLVPDPGTKLRSGDLITLVADGDAVKNLNKKFSKNFLS